MEEIKRKVEIEKKKPTESDDFDSSEKRIDFLDLMMMIRRMFT